MSKLIISQSHVFERPLYNKGFYKNHTHVKKVGHTSEFLFDIYWWTWKTNNYLKKCWSGPIKNKIILIFTMLQCCIFLKKKNHSENLDSMIYSSWDIEQNILKLVILGHFLLPFHPPKNPKNQISKKWKKLMEMSSFDTRVPKITIYDVPKIRN